MATTTPTAGAHEQANALDWRALPLVVIGAGSAGSALAHAWHIAGGNVAAVSSRSAVRARALADAVGAEWHAAAAAALPVAAIVVLAVPDSAIVPLAEALPWRRGQIAVHLSGALGPEALAAAERAGVQTVAFHPLCALTRAGDPRLPADVRFGYTGPADLHLLFEEIARGLGGELLSVPAEGRTRYHAAAVLASNDLVALVGDAVAVLERAGVPHAEALPALLPLLRSTVENLTVQGLPHALTGPLLRGDLETVQRHRAALAATPEGALYEALLAPAARLALQREDVPDAARPALAALAQGGE